MIVDMFVRLWLILLLIAPVGLPTWTAATDATPDRAVSMPGCAVDEEIAGCCCGPTGCPCIENNNSPGPPPPPAANLPSVARDLFTASPVQTLDANVAADVREMHTWCNASFRQRHLPIRSLHIQMCRWTT